MLIAALVILAVAAPMLAASSAPRLVLQITVLSLYRSTVLKCQYLTSHHNHGKMITLPLRRHKVRNAFATKLICKNVN
jgi:hypothetical protein